MSPLKEHRVSWREIQGNADLSTPIRVKGSDLIYRRTYDEVGHSFVLRAKDGNWTNTIWMADDNDLFLVDLPDIPEPPDGTRLELTHNTDVYALLRDDVSSAEAGWRAGDGQRVWTIYPGSVPQTWIEMLLAFGDSLYGARLLIVDGPAFPEAFRD